MVFGHRSTKVCTFLTIKLLQIYLLGQILCFRKDSSFYYAMKPGESKGLSIGTKEVNGGRLIWGIVRMRESWYRVMLFLFCNPISQVLSCINDS